MHDAVVVGGGPAGAVAARRLAAAGLETLLLERHGLPREKVCSGFLMDAWPLLREELGEVPAEILCAEGRLRGISLHAAGADPHFIDYPMPTAWRSNLDHWLVQRAVQDGASVRERTRLTGVAEERGAFALRVRAGVRDETLRARYLVGADGTASAVRRWLHPGLEVTYSQGVQVIYDAPADLPPDEWHVFFGPEVAPFYFDVHRKDGLLVLECGCRPGASRTVLEWGRGVLAEGFGFDPKQDPVKRKFCTEPNLYAELLSGRFCPGRGNALLVGDAAGLILPVTGEGILGAVASARLAADAVAESARTGSPASDAYLAALAPFVDRVRAALERVRTIRRAVKEGAPLLPVVARSWEETLARRGQGPVAI